MATICEHNTCTGCYACVTICKHSAISMMMDDLGFLYPTIDEEKCVHCSLCSKICPNNTFPDYHSSIHSYVAIATDMIEERTSTSGGLASVFARQIIGGNGIVYGCSGENCLEIKHIRIKKKSKIDLIKGSKYAQSKIGLIFNDIKQDLLNNIEVLFIGTPCQVAGLQNYLQKPYKNLYTIDFVCHGVPSQQLFNDSILVNNSVLTGSVQFRKKTKEDSKYGVYLNNDQDVIYSETYPDNLYILGFLYGLFYRQSCYKCKYARPERVSDITLGDYWDKDDKYSDLKRSGIGLSMLIINTEHGRALSKRAENKYRFAEDNIDNFIIKNNQLKHPFQKHANYELFKNVYLKKGFTVAAKETLNDNIKMINRGKRNLILKAILFKMPFMQTIYNLVKHT